MKEPKHYKCEQCEHLLQHYVWNGNYFMPTYCGHCMNYDAPKKLRDKAPCVYECEFWKKKGERQKKSYENIKSVLTNMLERIDEFINYFEVNS